ncbi:MAG: SCO family protein [Betaproteobacteria bacterium]|jgi:protein SCO1/2
MNRLRRLAILAPVSVGLSGLLNGCNGGTPVQFHSTDITGADFARDFRLTDHNGTPRSIRDFSGKAVVVFFGFTHCPDVCPTTLARLTAVMRLMADRASDVQVLLVTLDPERDGPQLLRSYTTAFHPSFLGLTGSPEDVARTAKEFRVISERRLLSDESKEEKAQLGNYTLDHSAGMYVFDQKGRVRLFISGGQKAESIAADLSLLLDGH